MWDNFIGQQIRRCNRNLLPLTFLLLGVVITCAVSNRRYLANFVMGTIDISDSELAQIHDPDSRFRFFVRVSGQHSDETGIQSIEQTVDKYSNKVQSTTVKAEYRILVTGSKQLLVVKTDPSASGTTLNGALEPMPSSVYQEVVAPMIRDEPRLREAFIPVLLNANDYREEGWWTFGIAVPLLLLVGWNLWKWRKRLASYSNHPIYWRLTWFGAMNGVVQDIETAMRMNQLEKIGSAKFYGPWLFKKSFFGLTCFHLPDLVWLYQKVTKHYTNFIPTGKSFSVLLNDRHGYTSEFQLNKKKAELFMARVLQQCPWIVPGYTDELKKLWTSQRPAFIAAVDERRRGATT